MKHKRIGRNIFSRRRAVSPRKGAARALCTAILPAAVCLGGCQSSSGPQDVIASVDTASPQSGGNPPERSSARSRRGAANTTATRTTRRRRLVMQRRSAPWRKTRKPPPFCRGWRSNIRGTPRCSALMARPWPMPAVCARLRTCCRARIRPTGRTGLSSRAQGSVADRLGDHEQARTYYAAPLKIAPAQPYVLSNLGLSYALSNKLPQAEKALQEASAQQGADSRVRQNLSLVLALEGKFDSAEEVSRRDLNAKDAAANVGAIRRMIAQSNSGSRFRRSIRSQLPPPRQRPQTALPKIQPLGARISRSRSPTSPASRSWPRSCRPF